ncbi:MAG: DUF6441 family protein [Alphaproteobacteria bacterium]
MIRTSFKFGGDFGPFFRDAEKTAREAAGRAIWENAETLKNELRGQVLQSGLGPRLAGSWKIKHYSDLGRGQSAVVYSTAPKIIDAFERGVTIQGKDGAWLAIPLPAASKIVLHKRVTIHNLEQVLHVKVRFVYLRGRASLLVADMRESSTKEGVYRAPSKRTMKSGEKIVTVPMFILVRQVKLSKRLDIAGAESRAMNRFADYLAKNLA